jgi:hypothetical protein
MISLSFLPIGETIQKQGSATKTLVELNFLTETPSKGFRQYPFQTRLNHAKQLDL